MSDSDNIIVDTATRIFRDLCEPATINDAETGVWPTALWDALEESGLPLAWVPEELGGAGAAMADGFAVLRAAGRFAVPAPLAETLIAGLAAGAGRDWNAGGADDDRAGACRRPYRARRRRQAQRPRPPGAVRPQCGSHRGARPSRQRAAGRAGGDRRTVDRPGQEPRRRAARHRLVRRCGPGSGQSCRRGRGHDPAPRRRRAAAADGRRPRKDPGAIGAMGARPLAIRPPDREVPGGSAQSRDPRRRSRRGGCRRRSRRRSLSPAPDLGEAEVAIAKVRAGEAAGAGAAIAHQVHGAMGFTYEHTLHHATRRLWSWREEFGNETVWATRLGRMVATQGADRLWPFITKRFASRRDSHSRESGIESRTEARDDDEAFVSIRSSCRPRPRNCARKYAPFCATRPRPAPCPRIAARAGFRANSAARWAPRAGSA